MARDSLPVSRESAARQDVSLAASCLEFQHDGPGGSGSASLLFLDGLRIIGEEDAVSLISLLIGLGPVQGDATGKDNPVGGRLEEKAIADRFSEVFSQIGVFSLAFNLARFAR